MLRDVFILASGHSGSTLLNLILGAHSRVAAVSELVNLPVNISSDKNCGCGTSIRDCQFWKAVCAHIGGAFGVDMLRDPYLLELGFTGGRPLGSTALDRFAYQANWKAQHFLAYLHYRQNLSLAMSLARKFKASLRNTLAAHNAIRAVSGTDIVVDASKGYLRGIGMYTQRPHQTRILLLTRDGRANYYSRLKRGVNRRAALAAWRNYYVRALPLLERVVQPDHVLRVSYEGIADNPASEASRLCEFLEIEFEPQMLEFYDTVQHSVGGNNMRFASDRRIRKDEVWQQSLTQDDLLYFNKHASNMNKVLGYQ